MKKVNSPKLEQEIEQVFLINKPKKDGSVCVDIKMKKYYVKMEIRLIPERIETLMLEKTDEKIIKDFVSFQRRTLKEGISLEGRLRNSARAQPEERAFSKLKTRSIT